MILSSINITESIISLLAGVGAFLLGFKVLSDNIERVANDGIRKIFSKISSSPWMGVGIGAAVTAIIQSSSATTVMIIGFVNAGIMNLYQATAMIMGANIGTTITAQIVSLKALDIGLYAMLLAFFGIFINTLAKKDKTKTIGLALCGLGVVFLALNFMSDAMKPFAEAPEVVTFLKGCNNPFLLLLFGMIFTALIQSSSATTTIVITMAASGIVVGEAGSNAVLYLILGSNIGTCITALISSIGASTNAKRASLIHLLFNLLGALIFFVILICIPGLMANTFGKWFALPATQIAMFHTFFNTTCTLIFIPFIKLFVKIVTLVYKDKQEERRYVQFIDERLLKTPPIALAQATKEITHFGSLTMNTLDIAIQGFLDKSLDNEEKIQNEIKNIGELNQEIVTFIVKLTALAINMKDKAYVSKLHNIINDYYREAEIADNMLKYTHKVIENKYELSKEAYRDIEEMRNLLLDQHILINSLFSKRSKQILKNVEENEDKIDKLRTKMNKEHIKRLEEGVCAPRHSGMYVNLVSNLERAGDHLNYIAHSLMSKY